ncbi:Uncharacterised protein [Aerococcus viridans]|uniref:PEP phosphonomutase n=2 Tax=Aerococcus viridans TaxID=1377 RepID=A0AAU8UIN2_9LACT|nr:hypothetical protein [Aerococcus viridans]AMC01449.1 PEP phosphonomutase [Aerococcus viridans]EFG50097.1 hypothetical protein HMPREF0061_0550 [Aerococcus viridans ATCC 11563 = CCUG 4311]SUU15212.1 Uncharacterised protein [Aerococcus viridans]
MKRLISASASEINQMDAGQLKKAIFASEGRTIIAETVVTSPPLIQGLSNPEVMATFGADIIVLNELDVFNPEIPGLEAFAGSKETIRELKRLIGRPIAINLEPVDEEQELLESRVSLNPGRLVSKASLQATNDLGVDMILLTGNPATGVTMSAIKDAVKETKKYFSGLVFAGKMHGAGLTESIVNEEALLGFMDEGADGVLIPAVNTAPGVNELENQAVTKSVHARGGLVMATIGTSQESAQASVIETIGLSNKRVGVDCHHIGDGAYGRMPDPENITALSLAVRGKRHTYFRMAQSVNR